MSYPLETVLAEKFETVVSRGVTSTRPCDLYDMPLLWRTRGDRCGIPTLREALESTCAKRGSSGAMARWRPVLDEVAADKTMLALWGRYAKKNPPTRRHRAGAVLRDGKRDPGRARMRAVEFRNAIPDFPFRVSSPDPCAWIKCSAIGLDVLSWLPTKSLRVLRGGVAAGGPALFFSRFSARTERSSFVPGSVYAPAPHAKQLMCVAIITLKGIIATWLETTTYRR